jgi:hypothetical protein
MIIPLEIVHIQVVGTTRTKVLKGEKYFMLLVDDYTRIIVVCFLKALMMNSPMCNSSVSKWCLIN